MFRFTNLRARIGGIELKDKIQSLSPFWQSILLLAWLGLITAGAYLLFRSLGISASAIKVV